jgi:hypothetical protein
MRATIFAVVSAGCSSMTQWPEFLITPVVTSDATRLRRPLAADADIDGSAVRPDVFA